MQAYLDESADERQQQVFAIAGWLGAEESWLEYELMWRSRTAKMGAVFHMAECECNAGAFSVESGWTKTQCTQLITDHVTAITRCELYGFGCGVSIEDFKETFPTESAEAMHLLCFRHCLSKLASWATEPVGFVFDQNKAFQLTAHKLYDRVVEISRGSDWGDRLRAIAFGSRRDFTPLQAADLLAYECFKKIRNIRYHPKVRERKSMARLAATKRVGFVNYGSEALKTVKQSMNQRGDKDLFDYLRVISSNVREHPDAPSLP
jgi:hypothetical protein